MDNITQDIVQNETVKVMSGTESASNAVAREKESLTEIIIGIPANSALMRVSVLTVNEDGVAEERAGEFNFEQLLASKAKVLQLKAAAENGGKIDGRELGESSGTEAKEEEGPTEEEHGREGEES